MIILVLNDPFVLRGYRWHSFSGWEYEGMWPNFWNSTQGLQPCPITALAVCGVQPRAGLRALPGPAPDFLSCGATWGSLALERHFSRCGLPDWELPGCRKRASALVKRLIGAPLYQTLMGNPRYLHFQLVAPVILVLSVNCSSEASRAGVRRHGVSDWKSWVPAFSLACCVTLSKSLHYSGRYFRLYNRSL